VKKPSLPWAFWVGLLAFAAMLVILYGLLAKPQPRQTLAQKQPSLTATFTAGATHTPSSSSAHSQTPQATATPQASLIVTATPLIAISNSSVLNTRFPTSQPIVFDTPPADAQAYQLKPWTEQDALQALQEAGDSSYMHAIWNYDQALGSKSLTPTPTTSIENYSYSDQDFYNESMLYETILRYPQLASDPGIINELTGFKFDSNLTKYGFVHNASLQPLATSIEIDLNQGRVKFNADSLVNVLNSLQFNVNAQSALVMNLFGDGSPALVVQLGENGQMMEMLAIQQSLNGVYKVFPVYPESRDTIYGQETFQVLDLNGDGRAEVAVSDDTEGIGGSRFCEKYLSVFEWNGSEFQDLMGNKLVESTDGDGGCPDPTFIPGQNHAMVIVTETVFPTDCDDQYYTVRTLYSWDGKGFKGTEPQPLPPPHSQLDMCTISWAQAAGPHNSQAVQILTDALDRWPADAVTEWGPASRDFFGLKLATWYLRLGQLKQGLTLLHSIASTPHTPAYPLPSRVANTFLQTYNADGIYQAIQAVSTLYNKELENIYINCGYADCYDSRFLSQWGFTENEWDGPYGMKFHNDFDDIDAMRVSLQADQPKNLAKFTSWLRRNQIQYRDPQQADLNGDGSPDWLVDITVSTKQFDGSIEQSTDLYAFLNTDSGIIPVDVRFLSDSPGFKSHWQTYLPVAGAEQINVFQIDQSLFTFRFEKSNGGYTVINDLPTDPFNFYNRPPAVTDWNVTETSQGKALVVKYGNVTSTYIWDSAQGKLAPTSFSPDLQEQIISQIEQDLYKDQDASNALPLLNGLLGQATFENYGQDDQSEVIVPRLRPYLLYLRGLAYELSGDGKDAVGDYWQLWHDYPTDPFAVIAQRKLEPEK
jgi:hypothetical protein